MHNFSQYKHIGQVPKADFYIAESDPDILIVVPQKGMVDTLQTARESADFMTNYARVLGKPCGTLIIMSNVLSQEPEARRVYVEMDNRLFFGAALVVDNPLSRALGSFFIGLTRPRTPTKLFDTVEKAIEWLKTMRPA